MKTRQFDQAFFISSIRRLAKRNVFTTAVFLFGGAILFGGCGDDKAVDTHRYEPQKSIPVQPTPPLLVEDPASSTATSDPSDPMGGGADPLSGTISGSSSSAHDPLSGNLNEHGQIRMPTVHTHWLRGVITGANVHVTANGVDLGTYSSAMDKDITMRMRKGVNRIKFDFHPNAASGSAHIDILESEHNPPIPPLATFTAGTRFGRTVSSEAGSVDPSQEHIVETKVVYAN